MSRAPLILAAALALSSCAQPGRIVEAQKPGTATGAGATLTGPANSAAPSTQHAKKLTRYFRPSVAPAAIAAPQAPAQQTPQNQNSAPVHTEAAPSAPPVPEFVFEETMTTLGQHQDAAPLIKAAAYASNWSGVKWFGLLLLFAGALGTAYGFTHQETGYPIAYMKVAAIGAAILFVSDNPWMLALLALPIGFYALQKLGALRPLP